MRTRTKDLLMAMFWVTILFCGIFSIALAVFPQDVERRMLLCIGLMFVDARISELIRRWHDRY